METERNKFVFGEWALRKLTANVTGFCCGDDEIDEYYQRRLEGHQQQLLTQSYGLFRLNDPDDVDPYACVDLCNDSISHDLIGKKLKRILSGHHKGYPKYPAVKITRLGVMVSLRGQGVGSTLVDMIKLFLLTDNRTGCRFLTVDAYNDNAKRSGHQSKISFYEHRGFFQFPIIQGSNHDEYETSPMFFDLKNTVRPYKV